MNMGKKDILLPEKFTIESIPSLFNELKELKEDTNIEIDFKNIEQFDSSAIAFLNHLKSNNKNVSFKNVTSEFNGIFKIFSPSENIEQSLQIITTKKRFEHIADKFLKLRSNFKKYILLLSDEIYYTIQYIFDRKGVYPGEIFNQIYHIGCSSTSILCLISFLVGITISITTLDQLNNFGADIYIADIVGFGMVRELIPIMTGIILAGKIGASITAEISSMKVLEEIDALKTMGLVPEKFLMVPRLIAITVVVPLLVAIADVVGIFGGVIVAKLFSGIQPSAFLKEMFITVDLKDFFIGIGKTMIFGWTVVITAGYKGFSVEKGAVEVGIATTKSVVLSISLIIVLDCLFALLLY